VATAIGQHYTMTYGLSSENGSAGNTQLQVLAGPSTTLYTETMNGSYSDFQRPWVTEMMASDWESFVDDVADRERAMRALEMSALFELRRGLGRGGCWLDYSNRYRNREQMLIPEEQWPAQRRRHLSLLRLPENPKEYLASLVAAAKRGLDAVSRSSAQGELAIQEGDISLPNWRRRRCCQASSRRDCVAYRHHPIA
jgi:hypothetical protein